jgi:hypothetical protein
MTDSPDTTENNNGGDIRDTLFGDMPASQWPSDQMYDAHSEPWRSFIRARDAADTATATEALRSILALPDLESRHYLQAWNALRALGVEPEEFDAKLVLGVVVEVALDEGLDIVAAYADHSARYINYSGKAIIWESPDDSLDGLIDDLLAAGQEVANHIGPWLDPRPPAPTLGDVRISMLTPSGIHFGQGPFEALAEDDLGGPPIAAATRLMSELIEKAETTG